MSTTTPDAIRNEIEARILAIVPLIEGVRFTAHEYQADIRPWARGKASACLRRVSVRHLGRVKPPDVSDAVREHVSAPFEVVVAYARDMRFRSLVGLDKVVNSDMTQIEQEVGTNGFATYATSTPAATVLSLEGFTVEDDEGVPVVFGVLPLDVRFWRAQP